MPPVHKSPLARLIDSSPLRSKFIAAQLGYTDGTWGQIRMGHRRLPDEKVERLAALTKITVTQCRRICNKTFKQCQEKQA